MLRPDEWRRIEASAPFRSLLAEKRRFIVPATVFFVTYYFALPILVGYFPTLMGRRVAGAINLAYLFALSQFFMAWGVMWLYVRRARRYDERASAILEELKGGRR